MTTTKPVQRTVLNLGNLPPKREGFGAGVSGAAAACGVCQPARLGRGLAARRVLYPAV